MTSLHMLPADDPASVESSCESARAGSSSVPTGFGQRRGTTPTGCCTTSHRGSRAASPYSRSRQARGDPGGTPRPGRHGERLQRLPVGGGDPRIGHRSRHDGEPVSSLAPEDAAIASVALAA
jgi:hypothetical protein